MIWTRPIDSKRYVIIGQGDYQYQTTLGGAYIGKTVANPNNITLFRGPVQYQMPSGNV